jgi:hypothetical protein
MAQARPGTMKGWRRIGVVLSVIWFPVFGGWLWFSSVENYWQQYRQNLSFAFRPCYDVSRNKREALRVGDPQLDQKSAKITSDEKTCLDETARQVNERTPPPPQVWLIAAIDAGVLAVLWLLAWMIVSVGRWIAAGFRQQA